MAQRSFLRTWSRRLFLLVVCVAGVLAFMYSERIGRYPWRWQRADLGGFADYCLFKFEEAREGTQTLIARFEDSELADGLDSLYERMNERLKRRREEMPVDRAEATPPSPAADDPGTPASVPEPEPQPRPPSGGELPQPAAGVEPMPLPPSGEAPAPVTADPAPPAVSAPAPDEPELSAAEQLFMQGYELKRQGNRAQGAQAEALYRQAAEVWKQQAVPALTREIELAEAHADKQRVRELEELYQSLNVFLHDIFKDSSMAD